MRTTLLTFALLNGCQNPCQELCNEIDDYATECSLGGFSNDEMRECMREQGNFNIDKETREICDANLANVREEWTCEDLEDYFED